MLERLRSTNIAPLLVLAFLAPLGCEGLQDRMIDRVAEAAMQPFRDDLLDDGDLHVVLCGTGSPLPALDRAAACTAVLAGGHFVLVDVGPGSNANLGLWRMPSNRIDAILLTHFHSDHIAELGEVGMQSWALGREAPLKVYGPPGIERVVGGFEESYALDSGYRTAHHGADFMPPDSRPLIPRAVVAEPGGTLVFEADGLRVIAFPVNHEPVSPAYGYRFEYRGRTVVLSGDTAKSANVAAHSKGADMLIHEALAAHLIGAGEQAAREAGYPRRAHIMADIPTYHTTPVEAAEIANESGVDLLVLSHLVPPPANAIAERLFLSGVSDAWDGEVVLGEDGFHFILPADSSEIRREELP